MANLSLYGESSSSMSSTTVTQHNPLGGETKCVPHDQNPLKVVRRSSLKSPDRNFGSPPHASPSHNVRFSSPISEVLIIPGRDELSSIPIIPPSDTTSPSQAYNQQLPQPSPETQRPPQVSLQQAGTPKPGVALTKSSNTLAKGNTTEGSPSGAQATVKREFGHTLLKRYPWRTWPVKQPINKVTLQHNLRHVRKDLGVFETKFKPKMLDSSEAGQAIVSSSTAKLEKLIPATHENTPIPALPSQREVGQDFKERRCVEKGASPMPTEAALGSEVGDVPRQSIATNDSRNTMEVITQVARKTTGVAKFTKASISVPRPRTHEVPTTAEHLTLTHPDSPSKHRPPLVSTKLSPVNGAKRKGDNETHETRPTKRPRVQSEHEIKLKANYWANELKACEYVGRTSGRYDQHTLSRLAKVVDEIDQHKEISTTHFALLSPQGTNVVGLLQCLKRGNGLEKGSPTRLKAKEIVAYWRREFRQQRNDGDSSA